MKIKRYAYSAVLQDCILPNYCAQATRQIHINTGEVSSVNVLQNSKYDVKTKNYKPWQLMNDNTGEL